MALAIQYTYHPMPPLGPDPQADITTPEKEEILLSPIRMPKLKSPALKWTSDTQQFDPNTLSPDKVSVEIEIGSSILFAYGTILRNFINLKVFKIEIIQRSFYYFPNGNSRYLFFEFKENIFGEDQAFTDMSTSNSKSTALSNLQTVPKIPTHLSAAKEDATKSVSETSITAEEKPKRFDPRFYRPLEVTVSFTIHDIQAHIVKVSGFSGKLVVVHLNNVIASWLDFLFISNRIVTKTIRHVPSF